MPKIKWLTLTYLTFAEGKMANLFLKVKLFSKSDIITDKKKTKFTRQFTAGYQEIFNNQLEQLMKKKEPSSLSISLRSVPSVFFVAASIFVKSFHYTALPAH